MTEIYVLTKNFPKNEKYGLVSQINRSAVSISLNIAEGAGRLSKKQFEQFLGYTNGSSYELETQLLIANNLSFITSEQKILTLEKLNIIQRKIKGLINSLKK